LGPWTPEGGVWGAKLPLDFENSSKKGCFHGFELKTTNFTTFDPPWKTPPAATPWKKSF